MLRLKAKNFLPGDKNLPGKADSLQSSPLYPHANSALFVSPPFCYLRNRQKIHYINLLNFPLMSINDINISKNLRNVK